MDARFAGKVVVITGAAGGIGRATASRLAADGARLVLVDRAADGLKAVLGDVERAGADAIAVGADVARRADCERYAQTAVERFGGIDGFFNNAGVLGPVAPLTEYPEDAFDHVIAVNVKGVWLGLRAVAPIMKARGGGAIVNTASIAGLRGSPNLVGYIASKHAVVGMTRAATRELARFGIRVNAVCPAPIETPMARELESGFNTPRRRTTVSRRPFRWRASARPPRWRRWSSGSSAPTPRT